MKEHKRIYSTECMISHRPVFRTAEPEFFRCAVCGTTYVKFPQVQALADVSSGAVSCCGKECSRLVTAPDRAVTSGHSMKFCIFGGFAHNTVRVEVEGGTHPMEAAHHIEWIYLRTFQGGQMKFLPLAGESATLFALANEDSYAFCDREICHMGWEHCAFLCKRGYIAYAYCNVHGLQMVRFEVSVP